MNHLFHKKITKIRTDIQGYNWCGCAFNCEGGCTGCGGCAFTCTGGCFGCGGVCVGTCSDQCTGCGGECNLSCNFTCYNTCKGGVGQNPPSSC